MVVSVVAVADQQPTLQVGVSSSTQTLTVPEGEANSYTLVLGSRPTGDVTVGVTLPAGTDLSLDKTSLTFTADNWDVAQTVTVTAAEDDDGVTDAGVRLTHTVSGGGYGSTTVPDVEVSITKNDSAGLVLSETDLTVTEGYSAESSYTVKLATRPSGSVSVTISGHDGTDLTLDKTTLTFTMDHWATAQTVTVEAGEDADGANDTATLTHTASGGDYAGITADLPVTVTDDDTAVTVQFGADAYTVSEGNTATITVTLSADPQSTVDYTAPDGTDSIRDTRGRKADSFSGQAVTKRHGFAPADGQRPRRAVVSQRAGRVHLRAAVQRGSQAGLQLHDGAGPCVHRDRRLSDLCAPAGAGQERPLGDHRRPRLQRRRDHSPERHHRLLRPGRHLHGGRREAVQWASAGGSGAELAGHRVAHHHRDGPGGGDPHR